MQQAANKSSKVTRSPAIDLAGQSYDEALSAVESVADPADRMRLKDALEMVRQNFQLLGYQRAKGEPGLQPHQYLFSAGSDAQSLAGELLNHACHCRELAHKLDAVEGTGKTHLDLAQALYLAAIRIVDRDLFAGNALTAN